MCVCVCVCVHACICVCVCVMSESVMCILFVACIACMSGGGSVCVHACVYACACMHVITFTKRYVHVNTRIYGSYTYCVLLIHSPTLLVLQAFSVLCQA